MFRKFDFNVNTLLICWVRFPNHCKLLINLLLHMVGFKITSQVNWWIPNSQMNFKYLVSIYYKYVQMITICFIDHSLLLNAVTAELKFAYTMSLNKMSLSLKVSEAIFSKHFFLFARFLTPPRINQELINQ